MKNKIRKLLWGILEILYRIYVGISMTILSRIEFGENVYGQEWDVLIVLDTARVDAMKQAASAFDFIEDIESRRSLGSTSSEWLANTFVDKYRNEIANTSLVSANPHVQHTLYNRQFPEQDKDAFFSFTSWGTVDPEDFEYIEQPWQYATDDRYDHVLPQDMTDRAVSVYREQQPNRMIVHFMQPHRPHMAQAYQESRELTEVERDPFTYLKEGGNRNRVFANHVTDLEFVLEMGVKPLLRNINADTVAITSDHGDGFGENWCYAHIAGDPRKQVRHVPWIETEATDLGELEPELTPTEDVTDHTKDRLAALGYI